MKILEQFSPMAHWLLRLAVASVFLYHGISKFPKLTELSQMMDMPLPMVFMVASMETIGAMLIVLGGFLKDWMTRVGAIMLVPLMLGAIFMVHWPVWDNFARTESHPMGGMEFQVVLLLLNLFLVVMGNSINKGGSAS